MRNIRCKSCGREVPWAMVLMYCDNCLFGVKLIMGTIKKKEGSDTWRVAKLVRQENESRYPLTETVRNAALRFPREKR